MTKDLKLFYDDRCLVLRFKGTKNGDTLPAGSADCSETDFLEDGFRRFLKGEDIPFLDFRSEGSLDEARLRVFRIIPAAGGMVFDGAGRVLLIRRFDRWDFPKGKAEKGESAAQTAVREVVEECGLQTPPVITRFLTDTWHIYPHKGEMVLKRTSWFVMSYHGPENLVPQQQEGITQACWCFKGSLAEAFAGTYSSLREVFVLSGLVNS